MTPGEFPRRPDPGPTSVVQALNDLRWVVTSPSLVIHRDAVQPHHLDTTEVDGDHLVRFLSERPGHRVGRYFESLVAYWLEHVLRFEMIGHGVQIKDGKRTVGEVDFLFRDQAGAVNHWEVTVKFFLHFPGEGSHFPGPNASDNFERKTTKLFGTQLPKSKEHFPEVTVRKGLVRGTIFYHHDISPPANPPELLASDHQRGVWLRESELANLELFDASCGLVTDKPFWLSPPTGSEPKPMPELRADLVDHFAPESRFGHYPVMVCIMDESGNAELQRMFVVPNLWPN